MHGVSEMLDPLFAEVSTMKDVDEGHGDGFS